MSTNNNYIVQCNNKSARIEDLSSIAFAGHAHMTAMQVRGGKIRGFDLHLKRLQEASLALFSKTIDEKSFKRDLIKVMQNSENDTSIVVNVYSLTGEFTSTEDNSPLQILIRTSSAFNGPKGPLTLKTFKHERVLPHLKHVGEITKTYFLRQAIRCGYDDAAYEMNNGCISEASIWNLAFWDGESVVWPKAPMLLGTTMSIIKRQLTNMNVPQREQEVREKNISEFHGAVVMNSWTPAVAVSKINETLVPVSSDFLTLLKNAYQNEPLIRLK